MPADAGPAAAPQAADKDTAATRDDTAGGEAVASPGPVAVRPGGEPEADPAGDTVIAGEQAHLRRSREFLHLMRENALSLAENPMAGDRVSLEYLKADLYRRAEALKDLPDAPLFFGRLEFREPVWDDEDFAGSPRGVAGVVPLG